MNWDKKNLAAGIMFIILAIICVGSWMRQGFQSYFLCGMIVFTVVAIAFLKRARK